jgi:hypothetical protein
MAGGPSRVERCLPGHTNNRGKTGRTPMAGAVVGAIPCGQRIIGVSVAGVIYRHVPLATLGYTTRTGSTNMASVPTDNRASSIGSF